MKSSNQLILFLLSLLVLLVQVDHHGTSKSYSASIFGTKSKLKTFQHQDPKSWISRGGLTFLSFKSLSKLFFKVSWKFWIFEYACQVARYLCGLNTAAVDVVTVPTVPVSAAAAVCPVLSPMITTATITTTSTTSKPIVPPPSGFKTVYMVVEDKMKWMESHIYCKTMGYELATIETMQELLLISSAIQNSSLAKTDFVWTAGNDLFREGNYSWITTGQAFSIFYPNVPHTEPTIQPGEDCILLFYNTTYQDYAMADFYCDADSGAICTKQVPI